MFSVKKRILALALVLCLLLSFPVFAVTPKEQADILLDMQELIREKGLESFFEDDPLDRALKALHYEALGDDPKACLTEFLKRDRTLYERLMDHMLSGYDSHTMYVPAGIYSAAFPQQGESYAGIGVTVRAHRLGAEVTDVQLQGGACRAGIRPGDILTEADGQSLRGFTGSETADLLRGRENTAVRLTVLRDGETLSFTVVRSLLTDPNFSALPAEDGIFYMKWDRFSKTDGSYIVFRMTMASLSREEKRPCLLLDLRDNLGGDLNLAFAMVSDFLPEGTTFFHVQERKTHTDGVKDLYLTAEDQGLAFPKVILLINENSASASEVLTAALCDTDYAVSVGTVTRGKARAQYHITLPDDSAAVLTSMSLLSLEHGDYEGIGLQPDYPVKNLPLAGTETPRVPDSTPLAPYSCSDNAEALNRALVSLGLLEKLPEKPYLLGDETMQALTAVRILTELYDDTPGAGTETLRAVNLLLDRQAAGIYQLDRQLLTALSLARKAN